MRLPVRKHLRLYQGDTRRIPIRAYTNRSRTNALPIDDRTFSAVVKSSSGSTILTATPDTTEAAEGLVYLVFSDTDTQAATPGVYEYDIKMVDGDGDTTTLANGPCVLEAEA